MAELVDALGLGSSVFGRGGSSPLIDMNLVFPNSFFKSTNRGKNSPPKNRQKSRGKKMTLLSKKDHEMVIEALEVLIEKKDEDNRFEYLNLLQWVKIKSKDSF